MEASFWEQSHLPPSKTKHYKFITTLPFSNLLNRGTEDRLFETSKRRFFVKNGKKEGQKVYKPGFVLVYTSGNHSSGIFVTKYLLQPTRATGGKHAYVLLLFGLASGGVYLAMLIANHAVRSYRTFSTLPVL